MAEDLARRGMSLAESNANALHMDWSNVAYSYLLSYARDHETFISEDVSAQSKADRVPQPSTDRAWGKTYKRAAKAGIIVQDGTGKSLRRHNSICVRWRSLIYRRAAS